MGDRANIVIKQSDGSHVFLYTHWGGSELPATLQDALGRKQRWTDEAYLARIIFCEMIEGDVKGETGFGISTSMCDNEYPLLVLGCEKQTVTVLERPSFDGRKAPLNGSVLAIWTFEEYIKIAKVSWGAVQRWPCRTTRC